LIKDIVIIKDGMPLLSANYSPNGHTPFSKSDNLVMLSGFFSAINSFSDQFEELGNVSELKLSSNDNLRLSFLRDRSLPNLVYIATFDEKSKGVNVQRALRKISRTFLQKYNINQILKWQGRRTTFEAFKEVISAHVKEEIEESEEEFEEKVKGLFDDIEKKLAPVEDDTKGLKETPKYQDHVPVSLVKGKINPSHYLTGKKPCKIFEHVDGSRTILAISKELNLNPQEVHDTCKNLVKLGFIELKNKN
jgi:hypothetical protein